MNVLTEPALADLSEEERDRRYDRLQDRLRAAWSAQKLNKTGESLVVIPSVSPESTTPASIVQALEERFLFLLLLLREPRLQMIYVTSSPIAAEIIEYYLALLPGVIPSHARARLHLVATGDGSARPLSLKLLERPRILERIRDLIPDPTLCHLVPYSTTERERDIALALGIPMYGANPRSFRFGTKSGCRRLFREEAVAHPLGFEDTRTAEDVVEALARLRAEKPLTRHALIKLNEGVAGMGNAMVDLDALPASGSTTEREELRARVETIALEDERKELAAYFAQLAEHGGVVEERIDGSDLRSPSVQLRVTPFGEVELLSTHDQLLGGPSGQMYLGCRFPADFQYARSISAEATKIGERLAREGVLGRFAVDFVVTCDATGNWTPYAIELNLRKGGTTHPFLTLQFLTGGRYDPVTALFTAPSGREKHMVATDHLESPLLRGLTLDDLFDIVARHGLHFDQARQIGIVFHMMSALSEHGRIGLTAVGDSPDQADQIYRRAERILTEEASLALAGPTLPPV